MRRQLGNSPPGTIHRSVSRKVRGKGQEQIRTFVNTIDGELDRMVGLITGNDGHTKGKRFLLQFLPKVRIP